MVKKNIKINPGPIFLTIGLLIALGIGFFVYSLNQHVGVSFTPIDDDIYNDYELSSQTQNNDNYIYNYNLNISLVDVNIEDITTIVYMEVEGNNYELAIIDKTSFILQRCDFTFKCYDVDSYTSTFEITEKLIINGNYIVDISITVIPDV